MSMLAIGVTGINAAQLGLMTTEHNISNANTEGFNRQRIGQSANIPLSTGSGFVGQGTRVDTVQRMYTGFVAGQVAQASTRATELDTYLSEVTLIDNMLADPNSGLSPALQDFFTGVQQVAGDPASLSARQSMVSATESLVARFRALEQRLSEQYASVNKQMENHVGLINSYAEQIADYNLQIVASEAGSGKSANDLLDQRDQLVAELNKEIRVSVIVDSNGSFNVFAGSGQQMVIGAVAYSMHAAPSLNDPERFAVSLIAGPTAQELPESVLSGGALGGLLRFRSESLDLAANSLGQAAASVALTFNAQHALGQDLLGNQALERDALGNLITTPEFVADFFQIGSPKIVASLLNAGPTDLAAKFIDPPPLKFNNGDFSVTYDSIADNYYVVSEKYNIPSPPAPGAVVGPDLASVLASPALAAYPTIDTASGNFKTDLTNSAYRVQFTSATQFTVTRLSDNFTVIPAGDIGVTGVYQFDGLEINVASGTANDSFVIQPTREIARNFSLNNAISSDPRLIAAAGPVRSEVGSTNTGSGKIEITAVSPGYVAPVNGAPISISFTEFPGPPVTNSLGFVGMTPGANLSVTSGGVTTLNPAPIVFKANDIITVDGISFKLSGVPKNGDVFSIKLNTNAVADSRNALALGKLQTQDTMAGGTTSFQGAYAQLVSAVGNKTREVEVTGEAQKSLLEQAEAVREAESGVNLDEEAANLIRYQQAYQAAARVIDVGQKLFDTLVSMGR